MGNFAFRTLRSIWDIIGKNTDTAELKIVAGFTLWAAWRSVVPTNKEKFEHGCEEMGEFKCA